MSLVINISDIGGVSAVSNVSVTSIVGSANASNTVGNFCAVNDISMDSTVSCQYF